jgi:hypothetical protein
MTKPLFTLPPLSKVARNALNAHAAGRLQATASTVPVAGSCYVDEDTGCCCAIGASMPPNIAADLDMVESSAITCLVDSGMVATGDGEQLRYLQQLHDRIVGQRLQGCGVTPELVASQQQKLLEHLAELAV